MTQQFNQFEDVNGVPVTPLIPDELIIDSSWREQWASKPWIPQPWIPWDNGLSSPALPQAPAIDSRPFDGVSVNHNHLGDWDREMVAPRALPRISTWPATAETSHLQPQIVVVQPAPQIVVVQPAPQIVVVQPAPQIVVVPSPPMYPGIPSPLALLATNDSAYYPKPLNRDSPVEIEANEPNAVELAVFQAEQSWDRQISALGNAFWALIALLFAGFFALLSIGLGMASLSSEGSDRVIMIICTLATAAAAALGLYGTAKAVLDAGRDRRVSIALAPARWTVVKGAASAIVVGVVLSYAGQHPERLEQLVDGVKALLGL